MAEQRKILRIFKLISLLKGVRRRTPKELADILEISKRTVYRYFVLLEELGFVIDVDFEGAYFIPTDEGEEYKFTFNAEESLLIRQSIKSLSASHNLSEHILKKLHMMSEQAQIGENILNASNGLKIEKLSKAHFLAFWPIFFLCLAFILKTLLICSAMLEGIVEAFLN